MKPERRLSNSVLLAGAAALLLALVALWFGRCTPRDLSGEVTTVPEARLVTLEPSNAVAEAATALPEQANLAGEAENSVRHEDARTDNVRRPTVEAELRTRVQPGPTTRGTRGGSVLQGHVRFATPPAEGENLTIGGSLNTLMPAVPKSFGTSEEAQAFYNSPEWREKTKTAKHFGVVVGADGSLTLDSVPPGTYTLNISASKPGDQPWNPRAVASGTATITVPEGADARSPIRLDEIVLRPVAKPGGP